MGLSCFWTLVPFIDFKRYLCFWSRRGVWPNVDIIFKITFFYFTIRKSHFSISMLNSFIPVSNIHALIDAIFPNHCTISISLIIKITSFVDIPTRPCVDSLPLLFIIHILPFISVCRVDRTFSPSSLTMFQSLFESSNIDTSIRPCVCSLPFRFSILIFSHISIPVCKDIRTSSVF